MPKKIEKCRICGNKELHTVLDLGIQTLTGVFPASKDQQITEGPLQLVKCFGDSDSCGLLQLAHSYSLDEMYGDNYGYRSGLNPSMVNHLHKKVQKVIDLIDLSDNPIVLDIGSNDGTTLSAYPASCIRVGMDPTAKKFLKFYPPNTTILTEFFSKQCFIDHFPNKKARVITSFSMFYDLEDPMGFMSSIKDLLDENGIWVFEQSYMPTMLEKNSYDTICHEHLEYYAVKQIDWMINKCGLMIIDIEFNDVNGGSFSVTASHKDSQYSEFTDLKDLLIREQALGLDSIDTYKSFASRVKLLRNNLKEFIYSESSKGKQFACLGASTKGNVILQYFSLTAYTIIAVGEVNPEKYGKYTPNTLIPILPESDLLDMGVDYIIVLPWHFRPYFEIKLSDITSSIIFPLPELSIINNA